MSQLISFFYINNSHGSDRGPHTSLGLGQLMAQVMAKKITHIMWVGYVQYWLQVCHIFFTCKVQNDHSTACRDGVSLTLEDIGS